MKQMLLIALFILVNVHFQGNSVAQNEFIEKTYLNSKKKADFNAMSYNQVVDTKPGAIQQLTKENAELKAITASLQKQIDELKNAILRTNK
jgi:hypothetical protein